LAKRQRAEMYDRLWQRAPNILHDGRGQCDITQGTPFNDENTTNIAMYPEYAQVENPWDGW